MWFRESKLAWFMISFLWVFGFLGATGRVIIQYYQGPITESLDTTRGFLGYSWSASILIGSLCAPFGGWLTDKFGYKVTMIIGSALGITSAAIIINFQNPVGYFLGFGIIGGLAGIGATTGYVIVAEWFRYHRAKALMIISSSSSIGLALLTPIFVRYDASLTWVVAYKFTIIVGVVFIVLTLLLVRSRRSSDSELEQSAVSHQKAKLVTSLKTLFTYIRNPVLIVVIFALFTCGFSMGTVEMHLMAIQQTAHVSNSMFIASLSVLGVLELVGGFVFAALLDRIPRALALSCLYFIRSIAFIVLITHSYFSPVIFTLIFGATYLGAIPGGILLAGEALKTKSVGLQAGILLFFHQIGGVAAAITGGLNYDLVHNYQFLISVNIVLSLLSCLGYYWVNRRVALGIVKNV